MDQIKEHFLHELTNALEQDTFIKITLGNYKGEETDLKKLLIKKIIIKKNN